MPITGHWYTRLVYNAITVDFTTPLTDLVVPQTDPVEGRNISLSGKMETLAIRREQNVTLHWKFLTVSETASVQTYLTNWGLLRKQAALTLDRLTTTGAQWEATYNTTFTLAELVNNPKITRSVQTRPYYEVTLQFRQGA